MKKLYIMSIISAMVFTSSVFADTNLTVNNEVLNTNLIHISTVGNSCPYPWEFCWFYGLCC